VHHTITSSQYAYTTWERVAACCGDTPMALYN
jgi:hypothetical protein